MGAINGRVIYSPKGKAGEYAENAANFFVGCSNGCTYCYLRKGRGAKVLGGSRPELKKTLREYPYALDIFKNELLAHKEELQKTGLFFSFTTDPLAADATARIIDRLATARTDGQLLVFEGNPLSLAATDRAKMDYVILDTEKLENVLDVRLHALHAVNYAGIEANRLLLTAEINAALFDEGRTEHAAVDEMSRRVVELGPYAGLAAYNIAEDYYHSKMNYQTIRQAIQTLNPSK